MNRGSSICGAISGATEVEVRAGESTAGNPDCMAHSPLASVVMPAHNAEPWIGEAISSVLGQTLSSWELIVVNDGSTDRTAAVVASYADSRIKLVSQGNHGPNHARNVGLSLARGNYIALLDADDWYEPRHLELTTTFLQAHTDCSLVCTNYSFATSDGARTPGLYPGEILGRQGDGVIPDFFAIPRRNRSFPITCCVVFRSDLIAQYGSFDETLIIADDLEFWVRWGLQSKFGYIDEPLSCYRIDTPGSNRKDLALSIRMRRMAWQKMTAHENRGDSGRGRESYARFRNRCLFRLTALSIAAGQPDETKMIAALWPRSTRDPYYWAGRFLAGIPQILQRALHAGVGQLDFVRYRQGKPAPDARTTATSSAGH